MDIADEIYPGGFHSLLNIYEKKQRQFLDVKNALPPIDCDFAELKQQRVTAPSDTLETNDRTDINSIKAQFEVAFAGQNHLLVLHALLIAILRRRNPPAQAVTLFLRLWTEQGTYLADTLTIRWKVSAATTFADHGATSDQRSLGMGLSVLFDSIKLHDSERGLSGQTGDKPFGRKPSHERPPLAFDMDRYMLSKGDADRNMLARLWQLAENDKVIFPLARSMLFEIMSDDRSIFARLQKLKTRDGH